MLWFLGSVKSIHYSLQKTEQNADHFPTNSGCDYDDRLNDWDTEAPAPLKEFVRFCFRKHLVLLALLDDLVPGMWTNAWCAEHDG